LDKINSMKITPSTLEFLKLIRANNTRDWFLTNKNLYENALADITVFAEDLLLRMTKIDSIETPTAKKSLMRIYRDVRFSKDKSPYKSHWGGGFSRATKARRGGYYYHIQPGDNTFVGGGFWGPNKDDLLLLRQQIQLNPEPLRKVISTKTFKNTFGQLEGDQLKTAPKGFDKEDPNIDLLRFKQFVIRKTFSDKEIMSSSFSEQVATTFEAMLPFLEVMSDYLTTDLNGESTID